MKCHSLIAALAACTVSLSLATVANALEKSNPQDDGWGGAGLGIGPGPGDLGGSTMPPGGDERKQKEADRKDKEAERKQKEAERKKKEAEKATPPVVKSFGARKQAIDNAPPASRTPPRDFGKAQSTLSGTQPPSLQR